MSVEDPWGDEPDWALSDSESVSSNTNGVNGARGTATTSSTTSSRSFSSMSILPAAQHILILIDSNRTMFQPYIHYNTIEAESGNSGIISRASTTTSCTMITPFDTALAAASHLLHHRIRNAATTRTGKRDGVGILLFNVPENIYQNDDEDENDDDDPWATPAGSSSLNVFVDLKPPGVQEVMKVRECIPKSLYQRRDSDLGGNTNDDDDIGKRGRDLVTELYGIKGEDNGEQLGGNDANGNGSIYDDNEENHPINSLRSALYESNHTFTNAKCVKKTTSSSATSMELMDSKTIWIFTNNDNPTKRNGHGRFDGNGNGSANNEELEDFEVDLDQVILAARDVTENDVEIRLMALPKVNGMEFDKSQFYDKITTVIEDDDADEEEAFIRSTGHSRKHRRRRTSSQMSSQSSGRSDSQNTLPLPYTMDDAEDEMAMVRSELNLDVLLDRILMQWKKIRKYQTIPMYLPDWGLKREREEDDTMMMEDDETEQHQDPTKTQRQTFVSQSQRVINPSPLTSAKEPGIMLDIYPTVRIRRKPTAVTIHSRTNKRTNRVTEILGKETGAIISKEHIRHYTELGGSQITVTKNELMEIKKQSNRSTEEASLILLGFKPMLDILSNLHQYPIIEKSSFAYPSDDVVKGSKTTFASLYSSMLKKEVMGIGELLLRVTATSRLVAIVPQKEETEQDGDGNEGDEVGVFVQTKPPGFLLIPLGYEDDIRAVPDSDDVADEAMVDAAEAIIRNQHIDFDQVSFENPALKTFLNYLESVALGTSLEDVYDSEDDNTKLNVEGILASCGPEIEAFRNVLPEDEIVKSERKRKAVKLVEDTTGVNWFGVYDNDAFDQCRVDELKAYLRSVGGKLGGRKSELVDRVKNHIGDRYDAADAPPSDNDNTILSDEKAFDDGIDKKRDSNTDMEGVQYV